MHEICLEMKNITKTFSGVKALDAVNIAVRLGEIHAICGENGAGKSTLMKVLSGVYPHGSYEGKIFISGREIRFKDIKDSEKEGIVIIHQELALIPTMSIAENIFLGNEQGGKAVIDWNRTRSKAEELLKVVGLNEDPNTLISNIGVGKQQLVEIAKAFSKDVKILILDEPTSALNDEESNRLLDLLLDIQKKGITSILISHKLNELTKVCNSITILRDGKTIETLDKAEVKITEDRIIKGMVGREIVDRFPKRPPNTSDEVVFEVSDWTVYEPDNASRKIVKGVNFNLKKGEVLGFAGLMGAGRTEIAMSIFGRTYGQKISGKLHKNGKEIKIHSVSDAIKNKIAYVSEDRKKYGLVLINDIKWNMSLPNLRMLSKYSIINENEENKHAEEFRGKLNIRSYGTHQIVGNLSGGNQQKVVLSKWIMAQPDILILDEPTRGIDVLAKYEIYEIINKLVEEGKSIILISSDLTELLGMSDRVYIVNEGRIVGELDKNELNQELIMKAILRDTKEAVI